jgi:hypothetical protein
MRAGGGGLHCKVVMRKMFQLTCDIKSRFSFMHPGAREIGLGDFNASGCSIQYITPTIHNKILQYIYQKEGAID